MTGPEPVPVLLYHSVSDEPPSWIAPFTVSQRAFDEQLRRIADSGRTVIALDRLIRALRDGRPLPSRPAVITFDDGFADFYWTVAPMLAEREFPATLFVTTGAIRVPGGSPRGSQLPEAPMLNWRQVASLDALGVDIGGHSVTHAQLDTVSAARRLQEIQGCKDELEDVLGHRVSHFAYPHGYSSRPVRRCVRRAGWMSGSAVRNSLSSPEDYVYRVSRLTVTADTTMEQLSCWLTGFGAPQAPYPERLRTRAWRVYRHGRALLGLPPAC